MLYMIFESTLMDIALIRRDHYMEKDRVLSSIRGPCYMHEQSITKFSQSIYVQKEYLLVYLVVYSDEDYIEIELHDALHRRVASKRAQMET